MITQEEQQQEQMVYYEEQLQRPYAILHIFHRRFPQQQRHVICQGICQEELESFFQIIYVGYDGIDIRIIFTNLPLEMKVEMDLSWYEDNQQFPLRLFLHDCYKKTSEMVEFQSKFVENLKLPVQVRLLIQEMIYEEKEIHIQDLGPDIGTIGTFVYVDKNEPQLIQLDQVYFIGDETYFRIDQYHVVSDINEQNMTYFHQAISGLLNLKKDIYGLEIPGEYFESNEILDEEQLFQVIKQYNLPFIQISSLPNYPIQFHHLLFAQNVDQDSIVFTVGRGDNNHIIFFDEHASLFQCCFQYNGKEKSWYIYDGTKFQNSSEGTRLLMSSYPQIIQNTPSDIIKIRENKYFGFQDYLFQVEIKN